MRRILEVVIPIVTLGAAAGCALDGGSAADPARDEPPPVAEAPPPPAPEGATLERCDPELAWATRGADFAYGGQAFGETPSGGLLVRTAPFTGDVFRASDGALLAPRLLDTRRVDAGWRFDLDTDTEDGVVLRDLATGEVVFTARPGPPDDGRWSPSSAAELAPDGETLVTATCWFRHGEAAPEVVTVASFALSGDAAGPVAVVPARCGARFAGPDLHVRVTPDGRSAVVAGMGDGLVALVDLETGTARTAALPVGPPAAVDARTSGGPDGVFSAALSPRGDRLALAMADGTLRQIAVPALVEVAEPLPVAVVGVNQHTYMPTVESPVAFSSDGRLVAHLRRDDAAIVVRRVEDGRALHAFEAPWGDEAEGDAPFGGRPGAPIALHFTADGAGLAASLEGGAALWRCAPPAPAAADSIRVAIEGPDEVRAGERVTFTVLADDRGAPAVRVLHVDGVAASASFGDALPFHPWAEGAHEIEVVVDDGAARGSARRTITVLGP